MNYNRIFRTRKSRVKIMRMLSVIPDKPMIKLQYRLKTGRKLDLKTPKRYSEKLQYYKLYYRDPDMARCTDKYEVRQYLAERGYSWLLNNLIGLYSDPNEIDFNALPQRFVAKDTLGSAGNEIIICKDKSALNWPAAVERMREWVKPRKGKYPGREWVYDNARSRIIVEKYLPSDPRGGGLIDYKFHCFYGKCAYVYVIADRQVGVGAGFGIAKPDFTMLPYHRADERPLKRNVPKPDNWEEMLQIAQDIAKPFPHARIDLYNVEGRIVFGEITFFDGSGYMTFDPDEFDFMLGEPFVLPERNC